MEFAGVRLEECDNVKMGLIEAIARVGGVSEAGRQGSRLLYSPLECSLPSNGPNASPQLRILSAQPAPLSLARPSAHTTYRLLYVPTSLPASQSKLWWDQDR